MRCDKAQQLPCVLWVLVHMELDAEDGPVGAQHLDAAAQRFELRALRCEGQGQRQ